MAVVALLEDPRHQRFEARIDTELLFVEGALLLEHGLQGIEALDHVGIAFVDLRDEGGQALRQVFPRFFLSHAGPPSPPAQPCGPVGVWVRGRPPASDRWSLPALGQVGLPARPLSVSGSHSRAEKWSSHRGLLWRPGHAEKARFAAVTATPARLQPAYRHNLPHSC